MTIALTPEIETAITEQAQREGVAPEHLVMDDLRSLLLPPKMTPICWPETIAEVANGEAK